MRVGVCMCVSGCVYAWACVCVRACVRVICVSVVSGCEWVCVRTRVCARARVGVCVCVFVANKTTNPASYCNGTGG